MAETRRIFKYPLMVVDQQTIMMPRGADILCVQMQGEVPTLWAVVDPDWNGHPAPEEARTINIYGTGNPMRDPMGLYIGTVQQFSGALVWHVFDATPQPVGKTH